MKKKYLPYFIGIEIVRGCNFKCKMCTVTANHKGAFEFMSIETLEKIIQNIKDEKIKPREVFLFNFGEPLAHPQFRQILELIYESKVFEESYVIMFTNGSLLKGEKAKDILEIPVINKLVFSFDGFGDEESYAYLRGNHFKEVVHNIKEFAQKVHVMQPQLAMATSSIIPRPGEVKGLEVKSLEEATNELKKIFSPMGVEVCTRHMHNYSGQEGLEIEGIRSKNIIGGCPHIERNSLYILNDGCVVPCCSVFNKKYSIGSIYDNSLLEILNSEEMARIRHQIRVGNREQIEMCSKCSISIVSDIGEQYAYEYWREELENNRIINVIERNATRKLLDDLKTIQYDKKQLNNICINDYKESDYKVKLELSSSNEVTQGYKHYNIVENMNIPYEDDYFDSIFVNKSLECVENIDDVMQEIYRVCKNEAIVYIWAAYNNTNDYQANDKHRQQVNEILLKKYDCSQDNELVDYEEWYVPESKSRQSNSKSNNNIRIQVLDMKFFYYKEYINLGEEQKRRARKAFNNVCDTALYIFVINKDNKCFDTDKLIELKEKSKQNIPDIVRKLNISDNKKEYSRSIFDDISDIFHNQIVEQVYKTDDRFIELDTKLNISIEEIRNQLRDRQYHIKEYENKVSEYENKVSEYENKVSEYENRVSEYESRVSEYENKILKYENELEKVSIKLEEDNRKYLRNLDLIYKQIDNIIDRYTNEKAERNRFIQQQILENQMKSLQLKNIHEHILEMLIRNEKKVRYSKNKLANKNRNYLDSLIMNSNKLRKKSQLYLSDILSVDGYVEYLVDGYGDKIKFFVLGLAGSRLFVELVKDDVIIKQEVVEVKEIGEYYISYPNMKGIYYIRFKVLREEDVVRILEVKNRYRILKKDVSLAAFID